MLFKVTVKDRHMEQVYRIRRRTGDGAADAARVAIDSFVRHGHGKFPFGDSLTVTVEPVEEKG